ncbi:membrane protein [Sinorhizobium fredii USDA 205]|uniref:CBS domain-containing protein n=1 Tax=Rhizobium fredii TaxID=380 RepID=A0A844AIN7_RHIFR|nr:HPP family protein [Sinorhizobium fredii]ASY72549.1 putative transmembrane protein [Sinorhizobium fredii CCBAU 83666]AWM28660.1 putative transmembrane protein [Sinorhizobium fredii CCBAU 25509]KSV85742.1 membrane protein [Sinorhizobium fredii USDA 205]MCG5473248.1 HPP family protein [Sinorhizobium fredii]MQX11695.1 CBS domain-containing protein [Sinorhizobium fredii]
MSKAAVLLRRFMPSLVPVNGWERLRSSCGALIGILLTGFISTLAIGTDASLPLLIAPMGASAVLLFAAPSSPLAQPWSILGGNVVASTVGVTCALFIADPVVAAAVAIAVAIGAMLVLGCLHPPSGAVALTAVLGGPAIREAGYAFVLSPVAVNSLLILAVALVFNNLTGRRYPHLAPAVNVHKTQDPLPSQRLGVVPEDLQAVLAQYGEVVDISPEELDSFIHQAQIRAFTRRSGEITCGEIMSRDVLTVAPDTALRKAWRMLVEHRIQALPVVTEKDGMVGILTQMDFMKHTTLTADGRLQIGLRERIGNIIGLPAKSPRFVSEIMTTRVQSALPETMVAKLVPPMADMGLHHMPVVDADNRVVGIVTQSDLIAALFQRRLDTVQQVA